jgi:hydrogenase maturation factor
LEEAAIKNITLPRERLEKVFHRAFEFIDKLAEEKGKDRWDEEVIREYFYSYHNEAIDKGEGTYAVAPEMLKELSRVEDAEVVDINGDVLVVEYEDRNKEIKTRNVLDHLVPEADVGDKVRIHYGYAVEIVGSE